MQLRKLHIDLAYLSSSLVQERSAELEVFCKAFPVRNGRRFSKVEFQLDWDRLKMRCPNDVVLPFNVRRQGPVPGRGLRQLPIAAAVHYQSAGPQRAGPPR